MDGNDQPEAKRPEAIASNAGPASLLALEPRMMFDGAAVATADTTLTTTLVDVRTVHGLAEMFRENQSAIADGPLGLRSSYGPHAVFMDRGVDRNIVFASFDRDESSFVRHRI